jgi:hypothetical protein
VAEFQSRALRLLGNLYRFVGGENLGRNFDTDAHIQPVHDVSREAERWNGFYWLWAHLTQTNGNSRFGADVESQLTWWTEIKPLSEVDTWILWTGGRTDTGASWSGGRAVLWYPPAGEFQGSQGSDLEPARVIWYNSADLTIPNRAATGTVATLPNELVAAAGYDHMTTLPVYVPHGSKIVCDLNSSALIWMVFYALMWSGPKGTSPPGMP